MDIRDLKRALASFIYDSLRDQDELQGHKMELVPISKTITVVKVWPKDIQRPAEQFTITITHKL